jgi:glyoxylate/hydroxypyruvate reductase A
VNILFYCEGDDGTLLQAFRTRLPDHHIVDWRSERITTAACNITAAIVWLPPDDFFEAAPDVREIYALAAGVDQLLVHPGLPVNATIIRLCDAGMAQQMAEYVLYGVLHAQRQMGMFRQAQVSRQWAHDITAKPAGATRVGILGAGALGSRVAERLSLNGYTVSCWSRSPQIPDQRLAHAVGREALPGFLSTSDVLVCLLPLTDDTAGILDAVLFAQLPEGAFLINPGRGGHLVEADLLDALQTGRLSGALLDVFCVEPLPACHRFWTHPSIILTPHVAAKSLVAESVDQIVESMHTFARGGIPPGVVDRHRGY